MRKDVGQDEGFNNICGGEKETPPVASLDPTVILWDRLHQQRQKPHKLMFLACQQRFVPNGFPQAAAE